MDTAHAKWRASSGGALWVLWCDGTGNFEAQRIADNAATSWSIEIRKVQSRAFRVDVVPVQVAEAVQCRQRDRLAVGR